MFAGVMMGRSLEGVESTADGTGRRTVCKTVSDGYHQ